MKTNKTHNDLEGNSAANFSDINFSSNTLKSLGKHYNFNQEKLEIIGISIMGSKSFTLSFICIDQEKSSSNNEHIVKILVDDEIENLSFLFKNFQTNLFSKSNKKHSILEIDEERSLSDL